MTSPAPGLRLLDESRTRDGQGEDLDEDDVWNVADDRDEDEDGSGEDSSVERSELDDEPTVACFAGQMDLAGDDDFAAASPAASSLPRAIARADARLAPRVSKHETSSNAFALLEKKPRVAVSASLGRLEVASGGRRRARAGRELFRDGDGTRDDDEDDDEATTIEPNGSFREGFVPPHVYATMHSTYSSTSGAGYMEARRDNGQSVPDFSAGADFGSMVRGKGHTLKGRDALKARTAVLRSTGFLERETPGTPRVGVEAPRQAGAATPAPISGFDVTPGEVAGRA